MLKTMKRAIALLLSATLTLQPMIVNAGNVQPVDTGNGQRPHFGSSDNDTPVINISTPNYKGVSHDRYSSFEVEDLILNNSATISNTRLGGWVEGNPNLKTGKEAKSWIAEVVGGNQAQLNGLVEVAGERMDVIIANEFGITCSGCGFINTGRTTLTTGLPRFLSSGSLAGFDVQKGIITIGDGGFNTDSRLLVSDRQRLDIISRAIAIYGSVQADNLNIVTGANSVDYDWSYNHETGEINGVTPQAGSGTAPELAVDASALGGMYANAIKLIATENGVGVRLNGEMASATNISLSANGQLSLGKPSVTHTPLLKAREQIAIRNHGPLLLEGAILSETNDRVDVHTSSGDLKLAGELSGGTVTLQGAGLVAVSGVIESQDQLSLISTDGAVSLENDAKVRTADLTIISGTDISSGGSLNVQNTAVLNAAGTVKTTEGSVLSAKSVVLEGRELETGGHVTAQQDLTLTAGAGGFENKGALKAANLTAISADDFSNTSKIEVGTLAKLAVTGAFKSGVVSELFAKDIEVTVASADMDGTIKANESLFAKSTTGVLKNKAILLGSSVELVAQTALSNEGTIATHLDPANAPVDPALFHELKITTGLEGLTNAGTLNAQKITLNSQSFINNSGTISASKFLLAQAVSDLTNAGAMISGDDLTIHAENILNSGGVIWANDNIVLARDDELNRAVLVQNTNGRIEAFQGNLTIRADEVHNIGTAPTLSTSQIIRWIEKGRSGAINPDKEILKLIDPAYLDADGKVLPTYAKSYLALWSDLLSGSPYLSSDAKAILKTSVLTPSKTQLIDGVQRLWSNMYSKANEAGTADPVEALRALLATTVFDSEGELLHEFEQAYVELWETLASGKNVVSDNVRAILGPNALVFVTSKDPATGDDIRTYTNEVTPEIVSLWAAMSDGAHATYDIVKILYQDRLNDDGKLAELVAGKDVDIEADTIKNIFGNVSAGGDVVLTANTVENKAVGATQVLLEVHKKPDCFTCHEGQVDYYDTYGGRIEAVGNVSISGSLTNTTVNTSQMSMQDMIDTMNDFIAQRKAEGDSEMSGVPNVRTNTLKFADDREPDHIAPAEGDGKDIREVEPIEGGEPVIIPVESEDFQITVEAPAPVTPVITPTASVDELLSEGLITLAETDPDFTEYANFITSNYMMDVGRLQYRDDLINNTIEPEAGSFGDSDPVSTVEAPDYLSQPVSVPNPDGSGMHTIYPSVATFELDGRGALIVGENVTISGMSIGNNGTISARNDLSLTGGLITGSDGAILAEGDLSISSLTSVLLEDTKVAGNEVKIFAGQQVVGSGVTLSANSDASISGSSGVTITGLEKNFTIEQKSPTSSVLTGQREQSTTAVTSTREVKDQQTSSLNVGGNLSIITNGDLVVAGADVDVAGDVKLTAGKDLVLSSVEVGSKTKSKNSKVEVSTSIVTDINAGGSIKATAGGDAVLMGTQIDVGGEADISAADNLVLAAVQDVYSSYSKKKKSGFFSSKTSIKSETKITNKGVSIASGGDLDLLAENGDLTTAGTSLASGDGDVNLTAADGNIYAGAYTDVHSKYSKTSKSILGGLFGSTKIINSVDKISRGTEALAALDLSLLSGEDTTLIGAFLSAGNNLNINTGGDYDVKAAINSQRREFFEHEMGLVLMTTITENSYVETAVLTQFLAGQALNFNVGGDASLTLYETAGVDAKTAEGLYPEELLAIAGLQILQEQLANEYFYDKQVALSPAFKALVAIAIGSFVVPGLGIGNLLGFSAEVLSTNVYASMLVTGLESFTATAIVESLDGVVSGNFDIGDILADAAFSGITAGLTAGINVDILGITSETNPELFNSLLGGFGHGNLSIANILDGALDGIISNGLSSAVYGTDFMEGFSSSMINTLVNLAMADVQFEIGSLGEGIDNWEGSLPHMLLHGLTGCAAAEATGASCAAGAAAAVAQSIYAGAQDKNLSQDEQKRTLARSKFIGALAGFAFSGGDPANVSIAAAIAQSGFENNYLSHQNLDDLSSALEALKEQCGEDGSGCSDYQARLDTILTSFMLISHENNKRLANCATRECINDHVASAASLVEIEDQLRDVSSSFVRHALDFHRLSLAEVRNEDVVQASARVRLFEEAEFFRDTHCGGTWDNACQNQFQQAVEDFNNGVEIGGQAQLVIAGLLAGGLVARSAVVGALEACAGSWLCATGLIGTEISAQALAEFATGGAAASIGFTIAVKGGSRVMQVGDDVVAVIDDLDHVFYRAADDLADGTPVFRNADGNLLRLNDTGDLVAVNRTGTVWDDITPTQEVYPGSEIPKSFELSTKSGEKIWVHGNATEHLAEYAQGQAKYYTPDVVRLHTQEQIKSMQSAVNSATTNGIKYDEIITVGGWELKFSPPREVGQLPALIHAQPTW